MHLDVTLFAKKSSNKREYIKLKERKLKKTKKQIVIQFQKIFPTIKNKKIRVIHCFPGFVRYNNQTPQ